MPGTASDRDGSHRSSPADSELGWKVCKSQLELNPGVHGGFGMLHSAYSTRPTRALARTHPIPPRMLAADQGRWTKAFTNSPCVSNLFQTKRSQIPTADAHRPLKIAFSVATNPFHIFRPRFGICMFIFLPVCF